MATQGRFGFDRTGITRRDVLKTGVAAGIAAGVGELGFLSGLAPVSAAEASVDPKVMLDPSIEPVVRL
nr:twin-arginine translocation signal domain-containing protein [Planctomycetota bacterium]